jgi:MraZ protein
VAVSVFRGLNTINLDAKGRMALPTRYRDAVLEKCAGQMILTIDIQQKCLLLYPLPTWQVIESSLSKLSGFDDFNRQIQRLLIGYASEVEMDANGRVMVPGPLRTKAKLDKNVVLVGQGQKFEVWDEAAWDAECQRIAEQDILKSDKLPDVLQTLSL